MTPGLEAKGNPLGLEGFGFSWAWRHRPQSPAPCSHRHSLTCPSLATTQPPLPPQGSQARSWRLWSPSLPPGPSSHGSVLPGQNAACPGGPPQLCGLRYFQGCLTAPRRPSEPGLCSPRTRAGGHRPSAQRSAAHERPAPPGGPAAPRLPERTRTRGPRPAEPGLVPRDPHPPAPQPRGQLPPSGLATALRFNSEARRVSGE